MASTNNNAIVPDVSPLARTSCRDEATKLFARTRVAYQAHLLSGRRKTPLEQSRFTQKTAVALWSLHARTWNAPAGTLSPSDLMFMCICYDHVCRNPKIYENAEKLVADTANVQLVLRDVQSIGERWKREVVPDREVNAVFQQCAAITVFGFERGIDYIYDVAKTKFEFVKNPFKNVTKLVADSGIDDARATDKTFGYRYETPSDAGETEDEKKAYLKREMRLQRESALSQLVACFIPWCSRVFLHVWADTMLISGPYSLQGDEELAEHDLLIEKWHEGEKWALRRAKFCKWMDEQTELKMTDRFTVPFRDFCFRMRLPVGAELFHRRLTGSGDVLLSGAEMFHSDMDDQTRSEDEQKLLDRDARDIWRDETHPHRISLALCLYAHMMKYTMHVEFMDEYVILEKDLITRRPELNISEVHGRLKLPLIIQVRGGFHLVYEKRIRLCKDAIDALILWMIIVSQEHDEKLEDSRPLNHRDNSWLSQFLDV